LELGKWAGIINSERKKEKKSESLLHFAKEIVNK
jgi:hypothetical protein